MAQVGLGTSPVTSDGNRSLSRYRFRVFTYHAFVQPALSVLDWLWRGLVTVFVTIIVGGLLGNATLSLITTGTLGISDPRVWAVAQPLIEHPEQSYIGLAILLLITALAYIGHRSKASIIPPDLQLFHVGRVSGTSPQDFIRHFNSFYLPRRLDKPTLHGATQEDAPAAADILAKSELDVAKRRKLAQSNDDRVGICVCGQPMLGTTRLAWESMKAEARSWTFILWPENVPFDKWDRLFRIMLRRHAKLVLWLDNLGKYTNSPGMVAYINSLADWIEAQGIRFVIVATCHEQDESGPIHQQFAPLFRRLAAITPDRITLDESNALASAMGRSGQLVQFNKQNFDGLPGSVVFGVGRMRDEVYPNLGQPAQLVLKTIKLLRSAGITEYTFQRVIVVARDVFHLQADQITDAIETVKRAGFLLMGSPTAEGQPTVIAATDFLMDVAVPDYPDLADALPDLPLLQESLERIRDGRALARLGDAFREQADFVRSEECYKQALPAFKRADAPLEWADLQYGFGLVLTQHASEAQDAARTQLLDRAQDCFTNVLGIVNQQNNPALWVRTLEAWREVLRREPQTTTTPSRIQSIEKALAAARKDADNTSPNNPAAKAEALLNVGVLQFLQARLEQNAGTRWRMFDRTIKTLEQVIAFLTADSDPAVWARAHSTLGDVCLARAEVAGHSLRIGYLTKAVSGYEGALARPVPQRTVHEEAEFRFRLGATLNDLAGLETGPDRLALLRRADDTLRASARAFEKKRYGIERAEAQCVLAHVLGQIASLSEGSDRIEKLTQAIIEYEDAIGVLDPEGMDRGDEIRVQIADLLWRRAQARAESGDSSEVSMDASRVIVHCDIVLKHEGTKDRNWALYQQALKLRQDAQIKSSRERGSPLTSSVIDGRAHPA